MIHLTDDPVPVSGGFWSLLFRPVLSRSGHRAGRLIDIEISDNKITVIEVIHRFRKIRIPADWITNTNTLKKNSALILDRDPFYTLLGRTVYDGAGRKLGKVRNLKQIGNTEKFDSFIVKKGWLSRSLLIDGEKIQVKKKGILLEYEAPLRIDDEHEQ